MTTQPSPIKQFESFREFWPYYLGEHSLPECRIQHFLGLALAIPFLFVAVATGEIRWLVLATIVGYGFAFWGHYRFEKNRPATFQYPVYSFFADWKMFWMMRDGTLDEELRRLGIAPKVG
jgi:hypothetical protein